MLKRRRVAVTVSAARKRRVLQDSKRFRVVRKLKKNLMFARRCSKCGLGAALSKLLAREGFVSPTRPVLGSVESAVATDVDANAVSASAGNDRALTETSMRDRHASAAEQRGLAEASRGIGDVAHVVARRAAAAKAAASDAVEVFGAPVRQRLRRQLAESRAKASAAVAADASVASNAVPTGVVDQAVGQRARAAFF